MRISKPVFLLFTLFWFAAATLWYRNYSPCTSNFVSSGVAPGKTNLTGFTVSDGSWKVSSKDNFLFARSGSFPVISGDMVGLLDSIIRYTKESPGKGISITGLFDSTEKNTTAFRDPGIARAEGLKIWLVDKGMQGQDIVTKSQRVNDLEFTSTDTLVGGILVGFRNSENNPGDLLEDLKVVFSSGRNTFDMDTAFANYIQKAKEMLQSHPDKKSIVSGYTDNSGGAATNLQLSIDRAAFVKLELTKDGISGDRIVTSGKGGAEPMADNRTLEGRAKNRRVTIHLQ